MKNVFSAVRQAYCTAKFTDPRLFEMLTQKLGKSFAAWPYRVTVLCDFDEVLKRKAQVPIRLSWGRTKIGNTVWVNASQLSEPGALEIGRDDADQYRSLLPKSAWLRAFHPNAAVKPV